MGYYCIFCFISLQLHAQKYMAPGMQNVNENYIFKTLGGITQDSKGFFWLTSSTGLHKYDGINIRSYKNRKGDATSLPNDKVSNVFEKNNGDLIIRAGFDVLLFDRHAEKFSKIKVFDCGEEILFEFRMLVHTDKHEIFGFGYVNDLSKKSKTAVIYKYNKTGVFEKEAELKGELAQYFSMSYLGSDNNYFWFRDTHKFTIIDRNLDTIYTVPYTEFGGEVLPIDSKGRFWYPAVNDPKKSFLKYVFLPENVHLTDWQDFAVDSNLDFWLKTKQGRFYSVDKKLNTIDPNGEFDFKLNGFTKIFVDKSGSVWIVHKFGLTNYPKRSKYFENYVNDPNEYEASSVNGLVTYSIDESTNGSICYLPKNNVINLLSKATQSGKGYTASFNINDHLKNVDVIPLEAIIKKGDSGDFWICCRDRNMLIHFFPQENKMISYVLPDSLNKKGGLTYYDYASNFEKGPDGKYYCINSKGVLWSFDPCESKFECNPKKVYGRGVIGFDNTDLWICTTNKLIQYSIQNKQVNEYFLPEYIIPVEGLFIFQLMAHNDNIWIATKYGLLKFNKKTKKFKQYTVVDGLSDDIIYTMQRHNNDLWLGTNNGLCRFNTESEEARNFYTKDGLSNNEFNRMASFTSNDGKLYFGGMNGINAFDPALIDSLSRLESAYLMFTGYSKIDGKTNKIIEYNNNSENPNPEPVYFHYYDKSIILRYVLLSYLDAKENTYSYFLENHDNAWNYADNNTYVNYPSPGTYTLHVKAKDLHGNPALNELTIPIIVKGPWWKTAWAIISAILLLSVVILAYVKRRTYLLRIQNKALEQTVLERTNEIQHQKEIIQSSLSEKETLLREIHHRVKNNLQIISSLLNIQSRYIKDENVLSSMQEGQCRVQAMSLIHQNLYQSDHLTNVNMENYLNELIAYLSNIFTGNENRIRVVVDASNIHFDIDTAIPLGLIVNELISNAFKYAFEKDKTGCIWVTVKSINEEDYKLVIQDNGKGFSIDADPVNNKSLGFKLVNILSKQLRGSFNMTSDNGAKFEVKFKDLRIFNSHN